MKAVRSRRQAADILGCAQIDDADMLATRNAYSGELRDDIKVDGRPRKRNGTLEVNYVNSSKF